MAVDENNFSTAAFAAWEDALEKLKVLHYEESFCRQNNLQPFSRIYFSVPGANASLQWRSFQEICSWLINLGAGNGKNDFYKVDKYDDPNTAVNKLTLALTGMGFELNFPANRLKQAHGEVVCSVLTFLTDKALEASGHVWRPPVYAEEETMEEAELEEGCDIGDIADETDVVEEEEDGVLEQDFVEINTKTEEGDGIGIISDIQGAMLEAKIDPVEWKRELERVGPKLKMAASASSKEWRGHVEQTKRHDETIKAVLPTASTQLALIGNEMTESVEKMRARERSLNIQHDGLREEYRQLNDEIKAMEMKHKTSIDTVSELTEALAGLSEELQELKDKMDTKGDMMNEASPLVTIKQSIQQLKAEVKNFDLRIGVVNHTLLSTRIRRGKAVEGANGGGGGRATTSTGVDDDDDDFYLSESGDENN